MLSCILDTAEKRISIKKDTLPNLPEGPGKSRPGCTAQSFPHASRPCIQSHKLWIADCSKQDTQCHSQRLKKLLIVQHRENKKIESVRGYKTENRLKK